MEKYVWASVLYYVVVVALGLVAIFISIGIGIFWGLFALLGYLALVLSLKAWRLRRHPRSVYQVELTKQRLGD
jgi:predicted Co/Zn/Cd cation transporter (cation efflux family)